jgi:hypothetical protein
MRVAHLLLLPEVKCKLGAANHLILNRVLVLICVIFDSGLANGLALWPKQRPMNPEGSPGLVSRPGEDDEAASECAAP